MRSTETQNLEITEIQHTEVIPDSPSSDSPKAVAESVAIATSLSNGKTLAGDSNSENGKIDPSVNVGLVSNTKQVEFVPHPQKKLMGLKKNSKSGKKHDWSSYDCFLESSIRHNQKTERLVNCA